MVFNFQFNLLILAQKNFKEFISFSEKFQSELISFWEFNLLILTDWLVSRVYMPA